MIQVRGHREINQIQDIQKRAILIKLRTELYRLCDEYNFEHPRFLVNINTKRYGEITYFKNKKIISYIAISSRFLHPIFMNELINTIKHEFAHMYIFLKYDITGHGKEWSDFCHKIGCNGNRVSTYIKTEEQKTLAHETYRYKYTCKCGYEFFRMKKFTPNQIKYGIHVQCKTHIRDMKFTVL